MRHFNKFKSKTGKLHSVEMFADKSLCGVPESSLELDSILPYGVTCKKCYKSLGLIDINLLEAPEPSLPDYLKPCAEKLKKWIQDDELL